MTDKDKLKAINIWINRDFQAQKKYNIVQAILDGRITLKGVKIHLKFLKGLS